MESWLPVGISAVLATSSILALTFISLHATYRQRYLLVWGAAFASHVARNICLLANIFTGGTNTILLGAEQYCVLGTAVLLLHGAVLFTHGRFPRWLAFAMLAIVTWIPLVLVLGLPRTALYAPTYTLLGSIQILCGLILWRHNGTKRHFGQRVAGLALMLWGAHQLDYPFLRHIPWIAPWGFLAGAVLALTVAIGIIVLFFEQLQDTERDHAAQFRSILLTAMDGFWLLDTNGRILEVNETYCRMSGYSRQELLTMAIFDLEVLESLELIREHIATTMAKGYDHFESRHRRKDGSEFDVEANVQFRSVSGGQFVVFLKDITEHKRSMETAKRWQQLFEKTDFGLAIVNPADSTFVDVNPAFARERGYTPDELVGQSIFSIYPPDRREEVMHATRTCDATGHCLLESVQQRKDGSTFPALVEATAVSDERGTPRSRMVYALNITERKQSEEALKISQAHMSLAMELAAMGHWEFDMASAMFSFTDEFYVLYGTCAEWEGGHRMSAATYAQEFLHPEDRHIVAEEIADLPTAESSSYFRQLEHRIIRRDGEVRHIVVRFIALRDEAGRIFKTIGVNQDITARKHGEQALLHAKEAAEAASLAKSTFLANMSHEIRTPLNGIMGMLQLLQTTRLDEEQSDFVKIGMDSSRRLAQLLSDILDLTRIESGKMLLHSEVFSVDDLRRSILEVFTVTALDREVQLLFDVSPLLPASLTGDGMRLRQILFNLVGNAIKFTRNGSVRIGMAPDDIQRCVVFTIQDTGVGIPRERLADIFEPFTQVADSYVRSHQGAGLGLAIVKRLVELMEGSIEIESEVGEGTTVTVRLPLSGAQLPAAQTSDSSASPTVCPMPSLRILLAEDDPTNQFTTTRMLAAAGFSPEPAANGYDVLDRLARDAYDLVLMDINMPEMDGVETTRRIRAGEAGNHNTHVPIIALTAYAMAGDRAKLLAAGMDEYVAKPVDMKTLLKVIGGVLEKR